jgi:hypothetical protein
MGRQQGERQTRFRASDRNDLPPTLQPYAPQDPKFEVRRHEGHYCKRTCKTLAAARTGVAGMLQAARNPPLNT